MMYQAEVSENSHWGVVNNTIGWGSSYIDNAFADYWNYQASNFNNEYDNWNLI